MAFFAVVFRLTAEGAKDAEKGWQAVQNEFSDRIYRIDGINFPVNPVILSSKKTNRR